MTTAPTSFSSTPPNTLQSATALQESLQGMVLQNQVGSAGNLIGKKVEGLDNQDDPVEGVVNSVHVGKDGVFLELDNGKKLSLGNVTSIASATVSTKTKK